MKDKHHWDINEYFKEGYFYVREYESWMKPGEQYGDVIYDTLRKIIETKDKSDWAKISFSICRNLLWEGKRWPLYMEEEIGERKEIPILKRFIVNNKRQVRSQLSITRDPFIALYACAVHLEIRLEIMPKIPFWLYSPTTWSWIRALKGKRSLYKPPKKFVRDLRTLREQSYDKIQER